MEMITASARDRSVSPIIFVTMFAAILISAILRFLLLFNKMFDYDEFKHLHNAWMLAQGFIPYVDFWENHTPLLMVILSPFARMFDESVAYLFAGRLVVLCASIGIYVMVFRLARTIGNRYAPIFAVFFLSMEFLFLYKTVEVRHDQMTLLAWLLGIWFLIRSRQGSSLRGYGLSGLSVGVGLLFSPKALFGIASLGLALALGMRVQRAGLKSSRVFGSLATFAVGAALPLVVLTLGFFLLGGAKALWQQVFLDSFFWPREAVKYSRIRLWTISLKAAPIFWVGSACGLILAITGVPRASSDGDRAASIVLSVSAAVAGLAFFLFLPDIQAHQLVPFVALLAIFGGKFGGWLLEAIGRQARPLIRGGLAFAMALLLAAGSFQALTNISMELKPLRRRNLGQLELIRRILAMTKRSDSVLDGNGAYIFRPQASFYGSLVNAVRWKIKSGGLRFDIPERCSSDRCQVVIMDRRMRDMPQEVLDFIGRNYSPSAVKNVYIRNSSSSAGGPGLGSLAPDAMAPRLGGDVPLADSPGLGLEDLDRGSVSPGGRVSDQ
jgi:4-amino-4-deoxy-L-arabinose transferase-like glycosyltransferase